MPPREINHDDERAVHAVIGGSHLNEGGVDMHQPWDIVTDNGVQVDAKGLDTEGGRLGVKKHQLHNTSGCDAFVLYDRYSGYMAWAGRKFLLGLHEAGYSSTVKRFGKETIYFQRMDLNENMLLLSGHGPEEVEQIEEVRLRAVLGT